MNYTRRDIGKLALAAIPAALATAAKPNSLFGGVQIGINTPYSFHNMPDGADDILKYQTDLGISASELRLQPVERALNAPKPWTAPPVARGAKRGPLTDEQQSERAAAVEALRKWRTSQSMQGFQAFRKKWNDAGVLIQVVKFDGIDAFTDDEVDYSFQVARSLGASAISCEIPLSKTERLGRFAEKHKMMVGYHGHTNLTSPEAFGRPQSWEQAFTYSKYNGANIDVGHFFTANDVSPAEFLKAHRDRITHVHLKDRKAHNGPNVPWGQGDTPLRDVLRLIKKEKFPFQATIEFEYPVPEGSTVIAEIGKCVQFCRDVLS
jgi:sugar phosphate isomerase/epimerase